MTRTVIALYDNFQDANDAVRELLDNGFKREDISLMAGDGKGDYSRYFSGTDTGVTTSTGDVASGASQGAGVGASIGAALGGIGGLLVGLGALVIPGIGPVLAAGPLAAALAGLAGAGAGALAGGITGGLIGALVDAGVPEETAQYYSEGIRRGGTLVSVRAEDNLSARAVNLMNNHNPVDINSRVSEWREQGWTGFDAAIQHDDSRVGEPTGTIRRTVDTDLENTEERYRKEQAIPTTGDRDKTNPSAGMSGPGMGGQGMGMHGEERGPSQNYSVGSSSGIEYGTSGAHEGEVHPDYSQSRGENVSGTTGIHEHEMSSGEDVNAGNREGNLHSSATDYDSNRMSDRDYSATGMSSADYTGSHGHHDFGYYDSNYHSHFDRGVFGPTGTYDQYQPAYRYGYDLATDPSYQTKQWSDVEMEARNYWEEREPGAWERFKDAVRYAWDSVRNTVD